MAMTGVRVPTIEERVIASLTAAGFKRSNVQGFPAEDEYILTTRQFFGQEKPFCWVAFGPYECPGFWWDEMSTQVACGEGFGMVPNDIGEEAEFYIKPEQAGPLVRRVLDLRKAIREGTL